MGTASYALTLESYNMLTFRNSHPRAPAPTKNRFRASSLRCMLRPNTAIWPSYLGKLTEHKSNQFDMCYYTL